MHGDGIPKHATGECEEAGLTQPISGYIRQIYLLCRKTIQARSEVDAVPGTSAGNSFHAVVKNLFSTEYFMSFDIHYSILDV